MLKVKIFTEISDKLYTEWEELWGRSPRANMVNSPAWISAALTAFGKRELRAVCVFDEKSGKLHAVAGLVKEKILGIPAWTVAAREFADKTCVLTDGENKTAAKLLYEELEKLGNTLLTELSDEQVEELKMSGAKITCWQNDVNPYIDFAKGKYGDFPIGRRNNLYSRLKKNNISSRMEFAYGAKSLDRCFAIEEVSAKNAKGKGVFYRKDVRTFYSLLAEKKPENVPVSILYFDNKPVSYLIGFLVSGVYMAAQKAFLSGYEYNNPGKLIMVDLIDYYASNGNPKIELGRGNDRFKKDFARDFWVLSNAVISKKRIVGKYISIASRARMKLYDAIYKHAKLYKSYTRLRDLVLARSGFAKK